MRGERETHELRTPNAAERRTLHSSPGKSHKERMSRLGNHRNHHSNRTWKPARITDGNAPFTATLDLSARVAGGGTDSAGGRVHGAAWYLPGRLRSAAVR